MIPHESDLNGGFNHFVVKIFKHDEPTSSLLYEKRRVLSKEPRVIRQVQLELSWKKRPVEMLWKHLSTFALPSQDYKITDKDFLDFLTVSAVSPLIRQRIFNLIREHSDGGLDALHFCKAIDVALEDPSIGDKILLHCFRSLPLPSDKKDEVLVENDVAVALAHLERKIGKGKRKSARSRSKASSAESFTSVKRQQLIAAKSLFSSDLVELDFKTFKTIFLSDGGKLASVFVKQVIEACAKYFIWPFGRFPVIPLRWSSTTTPLPYGSIPADADSLLLQDVEIAGADPNARKPRSKKQRS